MINISISVFDKLELKNNPLLNFIGGVNTDTGEVILTRFGTLIRTAKYNSLEFTLKENKNGKNTLLINGSLHKYFNNGEHNFNDFTFQNLLEVLNDLEQIFGLDLNHCILHNIEFGVNIIPSTTSKKILRGLLSYSNNPFKNISMHNAIYYQAILSNYYIKAYDKAKQNRHKFNIQGEILRFELKYNKMVDLIYLLKKKSIINKNELTLNDLRKIEVLNIFGEQLLKVWNEILFYDYSISKKSLTKHQKNKLLQWQNINCWEDLNKSQKSKQKNQLNIIVENHSNQLQLQTSNLIKEKLSSLLQKGLPFNQDVSIEKEEVLINNENGKGRPINSILNQLNGNQKQVKESKKLIHVEIPDYEEWINRP